MKNKKLAIAAIQNGCQLQGRYLNATGDACAVASLALAAGVAKMHLEFADESDACIGSPSSKVVAAGIARKFGLEVGHLYLIQRKNDRIRDLDRRRRAIVKMIETLPGEE